MCRAPTLIATVGVRPGGRIVRALGLTLFRTHAVCDADRIPIGMRMTDFVRDRVCIGMSNRRGNAFGMSQRAKGFA